MKREAVQEERQRTKERNENEVESTSNGAMGTLSGNINTAPNNSGLPLGPSNAVNSTASLAGSQQAQSAFAHSGASGASQAPTSYSHEALLAAIHEAEMRIDVRLKRERTGDITAAIRTQIKQMFEWAKAVPHFADLYLEDQCSLVKAGWNELLIAQFAHRSIEANSNVLVLANGLFINDQGATSTGIGEIFTRVLTELVAKMREMAMDKTELGCLRAVVLFNPGRICKFWM